MYCVHGHQIWGAQRFNRINLYGKTPGSHSYGCVVHGVLHVYTEYDVRACMCVCVCVCVYVLCVNVHTVDPSKSTLVHGSVYAYI